MSLLKTYFISDCHLRADAPQVVQLFLECLRDIAVSGEALYILGDLFDVWVGDDNQNAFTETIELALLTLSQSGVPVYMIVGNRDFLLGRAFCKRAGCYLLDDPSIISLHGVPTLICHGDLLCWQDKAYQRLRKWVRKAWVKKLFLSMPLSWRKKIAASMRQKSKTYQASVPLSSLDVSVDAVNYYFKEYHVKQIIHGHTHRPMIHKQEELESQTGLRFVLGDWHENSIKMLISDENSSLLVDYVDAKQGSSSNRFQTEYLTPV